MCVMRGVSRLSTVWVKTSAPRCCAESMCVCVCCTHNNSVYVCCVQTESSVGENNCYKVVSVCVCCTGTKCVWSVQIESIVGEDKCYKVLLSWRVYVRCVFRSSPVWVKTSATRCRVRACGTRCWRSSQPSTFMSRRMTSSPGARYVPLTGTISICGTRL